MLSRFLLATAGFYERQYLIKLFFGLQQHSMPKDTLFNGETTPPNTFLCSDLQFLPRGDPIILCAKHASPITDELFIYI